MKTYFFLFLIILFFISKDASISFSEYPWTHNSTKSDTIANNIPVPNGYIRTKVSENSFQHWLRNLPLKDNKSAVYLYNGEKKFNQSAHFAVINIDVGNKDLQQCADAVIRLRAEYLYSIGNYDAIHFNFTSGHAAYFKKWIDGFRPIVKGNNVDWDKIEKHDSSYRNFRKYLNIVFSYAGSYSLSKELKPISTGEMKIGDVFIKGGFPGHAVIVVDIATHTETGKKIFLIAQSYMPAQDIHILNNIINRKLNPWYDEDFGNNLLTPEWIFKANQLKRFNTD
ncbi:MAG: DUF4846 domain-containing protein [Desulfobacterales bacterium]|nr:DUF4846 domain-containing protein [Desulfobacterales bacterium]